MIIDFKYHIASLAAVFLALALGIVIGTTMIGSDAIMKKQESLIASLQKQYEDLRDENRQKTDAITALKEDVARQDNFNRAVLPVLVHGKLISRKVAVLDLNYRKEHDSLLTVLRSAGADIVSVSIFNYGSLKDHDVSKQVAAVLAKPENTPINKYLPQLAGELAGTMVSGGSESLLKVLESVGVLKVTGSYGQPVQDVLIIGGSNSKDLYFAKEFDLVLASSWQKEGLRVFGVEESLVPISSMHDYQTASLTTVDDIDKTYGQVALVEAMAGYPGHYGIKQTADTFIPPL